MMIPHSRIAVVLCSEQPSVEDKNLLELLKFFGINFLKVSSGEADLAQAIAVSVGAAEYCLIGSAGSFAKAMERLSGATDAKIQLFSRASSCFIFDFQVSPECEQVLHFLTNASGAQIRRGASGNSLVSISKDWVEFCGPMSGLEVSSVRNETGLSFLVPGTGRERRTLITVEREDVFFETFAGGRSVFAAVAAIDIDITAPVAGRYFDIKHYFLSAVPIVMYLRWAFRDELWMNTDYSASFIVDDPLLKPRYGFLVFEEVLALMQKHCFSTTIAFIPWNWRRTNARTAQLFLKNPERLSLVAHGNDHTGGEFGDRTLESLERKILEAERRMNAHEIRTGVEWSAVMVFPQGVFSSEALAALKTSNFLAAVNTEVSPAEEEPPRTEIAELWNTAIMKFASFPLFTRRYLEQGLENFAFDLLLGKPCLIVAHHEVFKHLVKFVDAVNSLKCRITWRPLGETVRRSFRMKKQADGTTHVQMFAREMLLENEGEQPRTFRVRKLENDNTDVQSVMANKQSLHWVREPDGIHFSVEVQARDSVLVEVRYHARSIGSEAGESVGYKIKCGFRRALSEFRDDYISRSEFLSECTAKLRRCLK
jgi:hypothetical protein